MKKSFLLYLSLIITAYGLAFFSADSNAYATKTAQCDTKGNPISWMSVYDSWITVSSDHSVFNEGESNESHVYSECICDDYHSEEYFSDFTPTGTNTYGHVNAGTCTYDSVCPFPLVEQPDGSCDCPAGQQMVNGQCEDIDIDACVDTIHSSGGNGTVTVNSDSSVSCHVGQEFGSSSCSGTFADEACFSPPVDGTDQCSAGSYGTFNGTPVCVSSPGSDQAGTSDASGWGTSTSDPQIMWEETSVSQGTNGAGESVTTTTTTTATATQETDTQPNLEAAPYTCEDGRAAADMASCDSAVVCDPGYYLVYGSCLALPATTTSETIEEEETTTTTTNNDTGEQQTETSSTNTTKPGSQSPGVTKVELEGLDGPCDPSEVGYLDCVSGEPGEMPAHTNNEGQTLNDGFQLVYNRMKASPVATAMQSVANIVPDGPGACEALSIDLSDTVIGVNESTSVHCEIAESIRGPLGTVMMVFYTIAAFRIFASA